MGWRKMHLCDVRRGVCVNPFGMNDDSPYSVATIISVEGDDVVIARPIAYASEIANNKNPMLYSENVSIKADRLCERGVVWDDGYGRVREHLS